MTTAELDATTLEKLISAAVAAPSIHNTQPWRYRLDPDTATIEVWAAADRALPHTDPAGRALHVSVGAAVFNLRVAVAHFGWEPLVRLLPRPARPALLATVRPAGPRRDRSLRRPDLYDTVWRRHSSRFPFSADPVPADVRTELVEAATVEGARLSLPGPAETARILRLTAEAEHLSAADPGRRAEIRAWLRDAAASDGIPAAALGPRDATGRIPVRDFAAPRPVPEAAPFEARPVIGVLSTAHDTRADWLRTGLALEHVLLTATAHKVRASLLSQATEWPDLRWALRDPRGGPEHVQMLVRLGYGPDGPPTPRRPAREVLGRTNV
ncbi:Acg family FMN-binding oxidoreductase [Actinacidiphila acididurans]|uniref:Nitroreductase family protein n=1 Tax=Actinacidiphila acididurans TaxID=2784346 RepID=A0ABS2TLS2_9ACTN|nr:nitroreductase family protein [Actinacidiphila acididurans]MBM9504288.1 nitroreductase family protein [Actinacidiphila acididurans]